MTEAAEMPLRDMTDLLIAWQDTLDGLADDDADVALIEAKHAQIAQIHGNKVDRWAAFVNWIASEQEQLKRDKLKFNSRQSAYERLEKKLRRDVLEKMLEHAISTMRGRCRTITVCDGKPKPIVTDFQQLPAKYLTLVPASIVANMAAIERDLDAGMAVPGAAMLASDPYIRVT